MTNMNPGRRCVLTESYWRHWSGFKGKGQRRPSSPRDSHLQPRDHETDWWHIFWSSVGFDCIISFYSNTCNSERWLIYILMYSDLSLVSDDHRIGLDFIMSMYSNDYITGEQWSMYSTNFINYSPRYPLQSDIGWSWHGGITRPVGRGLDNTFLCVILELLHVSVCHPGMGAGLVLAG